MKIKKTTEILYIPQFSMSDGRTLFIDKDGNYLVLKTILRHIGKFLKDSNRYVAVNVVLPHQHQITQTVFFKELLALQTPNLTVRFTYVPCSVSPITNRYDYNFKGIELLLKHCEVIFNNIPEITRNLRALLGDKKIPVVSLHHFCDYINDKSVTADWTNGNLFSYFWRQLDGYLSSDYNIFNCAESMFGWHDALRFAVNDRVLPQSNGNDLYTVYTDLEEYKYDPRVEKFQELTAVFNSRITESMYTNWTKVFDLFDNPNIVGCCIMTNPSQEKGIRAIKKHFGDGFLDNWEHDLLHIAGNEIEVLTSPNGRLRIVNSSMDRQTYIALLRKSHIALNFYLNEYYGGIAIREAVAYGKSFPIVPNVHSFSNWLSEVPDYLKFTKLDDLDVKLYNHLVMPAAMEYYGKEVLNSFLDTEDWRNYHPQIAKMLEVIL